MLAECCFVFILCLFDKDISRRSCTSLNTRIRNRSEQSINSRSVVVFRGRSTVLHGRGRLVGPLCLRRLTKAMFSHLGVHPVDHLGHTAVHTGDAALAAADAPGDDPHLDVLGGVLLTGADVRRPSVSSADVYPFHSAGTGEGAVQPEPAAQTRRPQPVLALSVWHYWEVHLLHDVLEPAAVELVLAVAGGHAVGMVKVLVLLRQADGVDVLLQLDRLLQEEKTDVVAQVGGVEPLVNLHAGHPVLLVWEDFLLVLGIPVAETHRQLRRVFPAGVLVFNVNVNDVFNKTAAKECRADTFGMSSCASADSFELSGFWF